jgi:hypothetical protein
LEVKVPSLRKVIVFSLSTETNEQALLPGSDRTSTNFQSPINSIFCGVELSL